MRTIVTTDRYIAISETTVTKRTLHQDEWQSNVRGQPIVPRRDYKYLVNEHAALSFIANNTNIKVPRVYDMTMNAYECSLTMERLPGVTLDNISQDRVQIATHKTSEYINLVVLPQLRRLQSTALGGLCGHVLIPQAIFEADRKAGRSSPRKSLIVDPATKLVYCHNDLQQHNILIDPLTCEVTGIIDWEYSGFFPRQFEQPLWERPAAERYRSWSTSDEDQVTELIFMLDSLHTSRGHVV